MINKYFSMTNNKIIVQTKALIISLVLGDKPGVFKIRLMHCFIKVLCLIERLFIISKASPILAATN